MGLTIRVLGASSLFVACGGAVNSIEETEVDSHAIGSPDESGDSAGTEGGTTASGGITSRGGASGGASDLGGSPSAGGSTGGASVGTPPDPCDSQGPPLIFILAGQSNMEGKGLIEPGPEELARNQGEGTLRWWATEDPDLAHLLSGDAWFARDDVWLTFDRTWDLPVHEPLRVGQGSTSDFIGPELGFGIRLGDTYERPIYLIKVAAGGKSLAVDFRPPSSGGVVGPEYLRLIQEVDDTIARLEDDGALGADGYELAGLAWHQGWNDGEPFTSLPGEYHANLQNLIRDLRVDLGVPELPVVIATSGFADAFAPDLWFENVRDYVVAAQRAVPQEPEFSESVAAVETVSHYVPPSDSPVDDVVHWNNNAGSYYRIGDDMADAMIELICK